VANETVEINSTPHPIQVRIKRNLSPAFSQGEGERKKRGFEMMKKSSKATVGLSSSPLWGVGGSGGRLQFDMLNSK
jgi:hypothetical protein